MPRVERAEAKKAQKAKMKVKESEESKELMSNPVSRTTSVSPSMTTDLPSAVCTDQSAASGEPARKRRQRDLLLRKEVLKQEVTIPKSHDYPK